MAAAGTAVDTFSTALVTDFTEEARTCSSKGVYGCGGRRKRERERERECVRSLSMMKMGETMQCKIIYAQDDVNFPATRFYKESKAIRATNP